MPSGKKPKPPQLKAVNGRRPGKDAGGRDIPESPAFEKTVPECPDDLAEDAQDLWHRIVPEFVRLGLLRNLDADALRSCCESYAKLREATRMRHEHGLVAQTAQGQSVAPWVRVEDQASKEFRQWCSEFGLTPAAAAKLAQPSKPGENEPFSGTG